MRINIVFHDIVADNKELTNKYSVNESYLYNFIEYFNSKIGNSISTFSLQLYFDDCYSSFHDIVAPNINRIPFPITVAVIVDKLNSPGYITKEQLFSISNTQIEIASHGISHSALAVYRTNELQPTPVGGEYRNAPFGQGEPLSVEEVKYQLIESKNKLEALLDKSIDEFVLPYGLYNNDVIRIFHELNIYKYLSTCDHGIDNGQPLKPRFLVSNDISVEKLYEVILSKISL